MILNLLSVSPESGRFESRNFHPEFLLSQVGI
jgi:hypothetical protein